MAKDDPYEDLRFKGNCPNCGQLFLQEIVSEMTELLYNFATGKIEGDEIDAYVQKQLDKI